MRACVIFNPTAKGERAKRFRRQLSEIAAECALKQTTAAGDARPLAAQAVAEGFDTIIAAGGDGTVNEVLNGIGDVPEGFARVRLGVLPLGTVNVFARELGIPLQPEPAWECLHAAKEAVVDLPFVDFTANGIQTRRYFAQLAGAGLDARAIELVNWSLKKKIGPLAYVVAGLKALFQQQPPVTITNGKTKATGELILIGNGRLYGGPFAIFPEADFKDGVLDICVLPRTGWSTLARCGPALLWNKQLPKRLCQNLQAESFTLSSSTPVALEVDGELIGHLPAQFSVKRGGLRVLIGKKVLCSAKP